MATNDKTILLHRAIKELPKNRFCITSKGEYKFAYITSMELASMMNTLIAKEDFHLKSISRREACALAKFEGYKCIRLQSNVVIIVSKSADEIESLKKNWVKDPCWDIEDTDGFEYHHEELLAWRKDLEIKHRLASEVRQEMRFEKIMAETGVTDKTIALSLNTFEEIVNKANYGDRKGDRLHVETALVHATLLQAAQLKRIADALENMDQDTSFDISMKLFGSEQ